MATASQTIRYKTLTRFPGYRFGDDGTVWSHKRGGEWRKIKPVKQHGTSRKNGTRSLKSMSVELSGPGMIRVHRLILEAFVGPRPGGLECCHWDGNPENNRLDNLRWDTPKSNALDSIRHGTTATKLTESQVVEIREKYASGDVKQVELAGMYGVSRVNICEILSGKYMAHIPLSDVLRVAISKVARRNQRINAQQARLSKLQKSL